MASSISPVYSEGPFEVAMVKVPHINNKETGKVGVNGELVNDVHSESPPYPLLVAVPSQAGHYPVVVLQHGFMLQNSFYSQLMQHVASHGYMVVAPQMYIIVTGSDATSEIEHAAAVMNWLPEGLAASLPEKLAGLAKPDFSKVVVSGHSRGGKVAFGLALISNYAKVNLKISGVAGLDPVDGISETEQTKPHIVSEAGDGSFAQQFPVLIVGTGLGSEKLGPFTPACAPLKYGHQAFYRCSVAPAVHVVAREYGHMDFLDDSSPGLEGVLSHCLCKQGSSRKPLRILSAGLLIAFLKSSLFHDDSSLNQALTHPPFSISTFQVKS